MPNEQIGVVDSPERGLTERTYEVTAGPIVGTRFTVKTGSTTRGWAIVCDDAGEEIWRYNLPPGYDHATDAQGVANAVAVQAENRLRQGDNIGGAEDRPGMPSKPGRQP